MPLLKWKAIFPELLSMHSWLTPKRYAATIKQIEIVGEACNHLTAELKEAHPEIEWAPVKGFRNISIHEYFGDNLELVWEIATNDLPVLKQQFSEILKGL